MKIRLIALVGAVAAACAAGAAAQSTVHERHAGKVPAPVSQQRSVASLSQEEIAGLLEGSGMGMAQVAELNRYPGPRHVLDLAGALELTDGQKTKTEAVFRRMSERAVALGVEIVEREKALDAAFAGGEIDPKALEESVAAIAALRGRLRAAHLLAHLETREILTPKQIAAYEALRGR